MWKSVLLATITGLLLALSWPTLGFPGLLFVAFIPLLIIEKQFSDAPFKRKSLKIFLLSWLSFIIWNALAYRWLYFAKPQIGATAMENQQAMIAYYFPVILNSLFMAIVFIAYHFIRKKHGEWYGFAFLPAFWMSFEKLHLNWDFSWPWLNLGNGFASYYKWIQWYDLTGTFGGTLWVWVANLILFKAVMLYLEHGNKKLMKKLIIAFMVVVLLPIGISYLTYYNYEDKGEEINVVVIQPELDPYREKYEKSSAQILQEIITEGEKVMTQDIDLIVTPETSFPGREDVVMNNLQMDPNIIKLNQWISKYPKAVFIGGTSMVEFTNATQAPNLTSIPYKDDVWVNRYNSAIQLENQNDSIPFYHKSKLVVGVEYFPYPSILKPLLGSLMLDFGGSTYSLTKSQNKTNFVNQQNSAEIAPTICYESIYGEFTSEFVKNGANLISISTNDSWWGNTDGHRQFLDYARLRAIENRRSVARSANSGISAFINQRGDVIESLAYEKQGALSGTLKMNTEITNYSTTGDFLARMALIVSSIILAYAFAAKLLNKDKKV
ncbi:apolipoprotein N-acyltransferase [Weeksellaceae bacterium KMM 9713]|uniref:Apolipoprotein N-acyltransferase n=1 Tax=Profundicola chukchiensis TaxID=2961959 RepID=A0A9X4RUX1_9FLAO|nr:apolipoprotein N-acyltransferase [Profundicola chukchiensis]MDG4946111.1 apolipoprotein N-acyltransferase [Profundicola chukchiensis]